MKFITLFPLSPILMSPWWASGLCPSRSSQGFESFHRRTKRCRRDATLNSLFLKTQLTSFCSMTISLALRRIRHSSCVETSGDGPGLEVNPQHMLTHRHTHTLSHTHAPVPGWPWDQVPLVTARSRWPEVYSEPRCFHLYWGERLKQWPSVLGASDSVRLRATCSLSSNLSWCIRNHRYSYVRLLTGRRSGKTKASGDPVSRGAVTWGSMNQLQKAADVEAARQRAV